VDFLRLRLHSTPSYSGRSDLETKKETKIEAGAPSLKQKRRTSMEKGGIEGRKKKTGDRQERKKREGVPLVQQGCFFVT